MEVVKAIKIAGQSNPSADLTAAGKSSPKLTITMRRQTPEEERQFSGAFEVLLSELVRQQHGREGKT